MQPEPAERSVHGTRATYQRGCRCLPCASANAAYSARYQRAEWTAATAAQAHLRHLATLGIGVRHAALLAGLSTAHVQRIRNGQQQRVKLTTERAILNIRPTLAKGSRVNAYRTRQLLKSLFGEGFSQQEIARRLGLRSERLQFHHACITVRNALRVKALWARVMSEGVSLSQH